ncbi:DUF5336 domain-containing protein [Yinghuangia soli]|uniref:DUF5336 domain-containing protein n=1 Tax=Yinghuangia soli TaxID=2908204 RepID=A0AA41U6A7_9ACTN|nr:DUF5336 domain-containing protein [Yinghuangia soli]MCF2532757.1 DUF5336 domain-containing protein [Yinghuangia soli]
MDISKITRVDAAAAGIALLTFIFSFLKYYEVDVPGGDSWNAWASDWAPLTSALVLTPIIGAALYVLGSLLPHIQFAGLNLKQWGLPLSAIGALNAFWVLIGGPEGIDLAVGGIFLVLLAFLLAAVVITAEFVPALKAPLGIGGGAGRQPQQVGGYGQPGGAYGAPAQPGGYGAAPQPTPYGGAAPAAAPAGGDPSFQPYWFSVPDQRQLVDANTNAPTASLNPGVWYLAVANHGQGIMVEVDGVRGVLWNVTGIQKSA